MSRVSNLVNLSNLVKILVQKQVPAAEPTAGNPNLTNPKLYETFYSLTEYRLTMIGHCFFARKLLMRAFGG
jgi:hypothetical protein